MARENMKFINRLLRWLAMLVPAAAVIIILLLAGSRFNRPAEGVPADSIIIVSESIPDSVAPRKQRKRKPANKGTTRPPRDILNDTVPANTDGF